jgi:hypothetical protein
MVMQSGENLYRDGNFSQKCYQVKVSHTLLPVENRLSALGRKIKNIEKELYSCADV